MRVLYVKQPSFAANAAAAAAAAAAGYQLTPVGAAAAAAAARGYALPTAAAAGSLDQSAATAAAAYLAAVQGYVCALRPRTQRRQFHTVVVGPRSCRNSCFLQQVSNIEPDSSHVILRLPMPTKNHDFQTPR